MKKTAIKNTTYLDFLRALAITIVASAHTSKFVIEFNTSNFDSHVKLVLWQALQFAVPMFLFISWGFMSKKVITSKSEYSNYLRKHIPRIMIPFLVWSVIYSITSLLLGARLLEVLKRFFLFQAAVPLYFVLLLVQLYLLQPIIAWLAKTIKTVLLALLITLAFCLICEYLRYWLNIRVLFIMEYGNALGWLIFPVLGIYIKTHNPKLNTVVWLLLSIFFHLLSVFHTYFLIDRFNQPENALSAIKASSLLYNVSMVLFFVSIKEKFTYNRMTARIAGISFGIFLSHIFFSICLRHIMYLFLGEGFRFGSFWFQFPIGFLIIYLCYLTSRLLRKYTSRQFSKYFGF